MALMTRKVKQDKTPNQTVPGVTDLTADVCGGKRFSIFQVIFT